MEYNQIKVIKVVSTQALVWCLMYLKEPISQLHVNTLYSRRHAAITDLNVKE